MARLLVAIALTTVVCFAAPKERAWQNGRVLDNRDTHYFTATEISNGASKDGVKDQYGGIDYSTNSSGASITVFENFMFESPDAVYLVQVARLRSARPIRVSAIVPVKLAVENKKLWFVDQEGAEYQAAVLKMVQKQPTQVVLVDPAKAPAPAQAEPKPAPVVVAVKAPEPAPAAVKPAPVVKTETAEAGTCACASPNRWWSRGRFRSRTRQLRAPPSRRHRRPFPRPRRRRPRQSRNPNRQSPQRWNRSRSPWLRSLHPRKRLRLRLARMRRLAP